MRATSLPPTRPARHQLPLYPAVCKQNKPPAQRFIAQAATESIAVSTTHTWATTYDNRNRLTGFTRAGSETHFQYNSNSNRLTSIDKTTSDTNANGSYDLPDTALTTSQTTTLAATSICPPAHPASPTAWTQQAT